MEIPEAPKGVFQPAAKSAFNLIILVGVIFIAGFETCRAVAPKEAGAAEPASMVERGAELIPRLVRIEEALVDVKQHLAVVESRVDDLRDRARRADAAANK